MEASPPQKLDLAEKELAWLLREVKKSLDTPTYIVDKVIQVLRPETKESATIPHRYYGTNYFFMYCCEQALLAEVEKLDRVLPGGWHRAATALHVHYHSRG